jgi:hypothetical protein
MTMSSDAQTFDLDTEVSRQVYRNRRVARYMVGVTAVAFFGLTAYGLAGLPQSFSASTESLAIHVGATVLVAILAVMAACGALISFGRPAVQLSLTDSDLILRFPAQSAPLRVRWSGTRFNLLVRDFRDHPTPASNICQIERIGRAPFWLQRPSSPLTSEAFEALTSKARQKGLTVTQKKGATFFALYPNTEITIRRAPTR